MTDSDSSPVEKLAKWREYASIFALVATPILVPFLVAWIQYGAAQRSVNQQYVALAVGILQKPKPQTKDPGDIQLRQWAVDLIDKTAPIPLPVGLRDKLSNGDVQFSGMAENVTSGSGTLTSPTDMAEHR